MDFGKVDQKNGVLPVMLSIKQKIINQNKIVPAISIIGTISYERIASRDFRSDKVPVNFIMAFENELSNYCTVGYNFGTTTFNKDLRFSFCFEFSPIDKLTGFIEYFADFEITSHPSHNVDAGILYAINERLQVDFVLGKGIYDSIDKDFFTFGISYRFKNKALN